MLYLSTFRGCYVFLHRSALFTPPFRARPSALPSAPATARSRRVRGAARGARRGSGYRGQTGRNWMLIRGPTACFVFRMACS